MNNCDVGWYSRIAMSDTLLSVSVVFDVLLSLGVRNAKKCC